MLIVCFYAAFSAVADEKALTNKVENSKSFDTATNKVETTAEQRLLAAFPLSCLLVATRRLAPEELHPTYETYRLI